MNPTFEAFPLEGLQVPPAGPMAIKFEWQWFPLLDQDIIDLAAEDTWNGYLYTQGPFEYAKRGGRSDGRNNRGEIEVGWSYSSGLYCYFPLAVPRVTAYRLGVKCSGYRIERTIGYVNYDDIWRWNFFRESVCQHANDGNLTKDDLSSDFLGLEEDPDGLEGTTFVWVPEFTESANNADCNDTTTRTDLQPWRRLLQPEIVQDGNSGIDVEARINELFPYPEDPTPEQTQLVDDQRAWAKRFAIPLNWEKQKRFFDDAVLRQGDIPIWNLVRIPSWEINRTYSVRKAKNRQDALANFGDLIWLGWEEKNARDVNMLCRLRWPQMIRIPDITTDDMGFPSYFKMAEEYLPNGDWSIVENPAQSNTAHGIGSSFSTGYGWTHPEIGSGFVPENNARFRQGAEFLKTRIQTFVVDTDRGEKMPNEFWEEADIPTDFVNFDFIENSGVIAFSPEQAVSFAPPSLKITSIFAFEDNSQGYLIPLTIVWQAQAFKVPIRVGGEITGFKYVLGPTFASGLMNGVDITPEFVAFANWATAFFCDPAKYKKIGVYKITDPDNQSAPMVSVDLYGHQELYTKFDVEVIMQS